MAIVKTDVPTTYALAQAAIRGIVEAYPFCRRRNLTTTAFGRSVDALIIGEGPRQVLFTAAHHANEWITATVQLKFAEELAQAISTGGAIYGVPARTLREQVTVHLVPMVDPDGVELVTGAIEPGSPQFDIALGFADNYPAIPFPDGWKANLLGVDLNLQYPALWLRARTIKFSQGYDRPGPRDFVGRAPLTQRESFALAQYTQEVDPALILAYHTQGEVIYWQFLDYDVPGAEALAKEFARVSGYALEDVPYASSFAGYKDWFIQNFRRPGFTIECGAGDNPLPITLFPEIYRENLGILGTAATGLPGGI